MVNNVSEAMGIDLMSHSEIDFVDVFVHSDVKLFIDPCLLNSGKDEWSKKANEAVKSYFKAFYQLYKLNKSNKEKLELFRYAHEINAAKLGYGNGHNGHAKTPIGMLETFKPISKLTDDGIVLNNASDLPILIYGFAEDCLSDMLINIIFKVLSDFTLHQCSKYGIKTDKITHEYHYWNPIKSEWTLYEGEFLLVEGKEILLVPKNFVRNRYYFNSSQYFTRIILEQKQAEEQYTDESGKLIRPEKKELRKKYHKSKRMLDTILGFTKNNPNFLVEYNKRLPTLYVNQNMTDEELDKILHNKVS